ncbi:hypothetical protein RBB75_04520 [Tunturibacter empetritectus]|uniref:Uncharacterized protein n=1 Tax=Tunturiibacter empetritectus TaxID=3069691 RepID=A0AAU7ZFP1_9BACT
MKRFLGAFALVLALVTGSYAATQHSASVTLYETVYVGSNALPAGDYTLHWPDGSGVVDLSITGNRQKVSIPITVTPSAIVTNGAILTVSGDKTLVQGFSTKFGNLMIKDAATK